MKMTKKEHDTKRDQLNNNLDELAEAIYEARHEKNYRSMKFIQVEFDIVAADLKKLATTSIIINHSAS